MFNWLIGQPHEAMRKQGAERNPRFHRESRLWLKDHPTCARCGGKKSLQVHHVEPFHLHIMRPDLYPVDKEMDPANWIPLCMAKPWYCHIVAGHGGDFKMWIPTVREDCAAELKRILDARARLKKLMEKK